MARVNSESCQRCHDPKSAVIGAIIVEKSLAPAEASVASNRNLLIVYGFVIFILVSVVLWLLIVRFVTQPVSNLLEQMRRVKAGDLKARAATQHPGRDRRTRARIQRHGAKPR